MRRREFITLLGSTATWPLAAGAQQPQRMRRIGVLVGGQETDPVRRLWMAEFQTALQKLGWNDGRNIKIDSRWAAADSNRAMALANDLVALKPDVLFADNTFVAKALQAATHSVPIVFARITDPIASGFVNDLARPGANMTGFSNYERSILTKYVQFMRDVAPDVRRIGVVVSAIATGPSLDVIVDAASSADSKVAAIKGDSAREFEDGIAEFAQGPKGGLIMPGDPVTTAHLRLIIGIADRYKIPVMGTYPFLPAAGGLLSYSAGIREQYEGAAGYIDRILKGEKPSELPVQLPTKYELRVNLRTAKALGLTVPPSLLATAEEVIE
jgi:putative ABC transport system substrate-binding protein